MFNECLCARYQSNTKESHFSAANRILKYLKGTTKVGLWYRSEVSLNLVGYSDFAGCELDRKTLLKHATYLDQSLISWHNKKQACVALSIAEAKCIVAGSFCAQSLGSSNN